MIAQRSSVYTKKFQKLMVTIRKALGGRVKKSNLARFPDPPGKISGAAAQGIRQPPFLVKENMEGEVTRKKVERKGQGLSFPPAGGRRTGLGPAIRTPGIKSL
jgi:hypothetical protein